MRNIFTFFAKVDNRVISDIKRLQISQAIEKFNDCWVEITVKKHLGKVRDRQRGYWFGVIVTAIIDYSGYDGAHAKENCHDDLLFHLMPELRHERVNFLTGEVREKRVSWTELDTNETTILIERAWQFAASECGLIIQSPKEFLETNNRKKRL